MPVAASMARVTISRPSASVSRLYPASIETRRHFKRRKKLGAEPLRLRQGAARQVAAADAGRKPQIVLDARTGARLPARRVPVEQQRPQPFRCAVHRRRQARRTGADDHKVVHIECSRERPAEALGHLAGFRIAQHGDSVFEEQRRKLVGAHSGRVQ